jgi:transposase
MAACPRHPRAPQKTLDEHVKGQAKLLDDELNPRLEEAKRGQRQVFFVDAAHFVYGTFLCCLWSLVRLYGRAASGRQRFNVLGALNAVTKELIAVTNTTVLNSETMCALLRQIAAVGPVGPVTLVLDNARYQPNEAVMTLAKALAIELLFLPGYSPNRNLIERLWRFIKREALYGRYHACFADFKAAIEEVIGQMPSKYKGRLASLLTLNFQVFDNVSLLAA